MNIGFAVPNFLVSTLFIYFFAVWLKRLHLPTNGWELAEVVDFARLALGHVPDDVLRAARSRLDAGDAATGLRPHREGEGPPLARVVTKHVLRNSLIPAVTATGPLLGYLVAGSFIIEIIFGIPGIGRYYVISVQARDYSVVMGITVLLAFIIIFANLCVDILYGFLDPRTRDVRT